jgi:hypothetical protein
MLKATLIPSMELFHVLDKKLLGMVLIDIFGEKKPDPEFYN